MEIGSCGLTYRRMLFRLKGDRLSWQERLGANGIDNVQYKQNMGPVPRPKSCKDGSRT